MQKSGCSLRKSENPLYNNIPSEKKFAFKVGNPKTNFNLYGTTHVVDLYKNILLEKYKNGDYEAEIRIHR